MGIRSYAGSWEMMGHACYKTPRKPVLKPLSDFHPREIASLNPRISYCSSWGIHDLRLGWARDFGVTDF